MKAGFIDWTETNLNFYVLDKQENRYNIADRVSVNIEGELNASKLTQLAGIDIDTIYISLPLNYLTLRELNFPFSDKKKIKETISYELEGILLGSTSDYTIDHIVIESLESSNRILAVCLEKLKLGEIIDIFSSAGLEPKVITSVDLRIVGGRIEGLIEEPTSDRTIREKAVREEILNPSVNLRQDELAYTGDIELLKKNLKFTAALVLTALIILGTLSTLRLMNAKNEHESLTKRMHAIYLNVFPGDKKVVDIERQLKGNFQMLMKKKSALSGVSVLDILRDIAVHKGNNITLNEFIADGKNILIKGSAASFKDVESLKINLASVFHNVKVMSSDAAADKKINFTIIMQDKTV
jgi:type II secretory pathway component PulL